MKRIVRGIVTGSLIGAAVGLAMLMRNRRGMAMGMKAMPTDKLKQQTRGTVKMVRDNTKRWASAFKDSKEAFSHRLARRNP